ncbi:DUF6538 domain-containing protein [Methylobacterium marchantiae]|uniref:DUF6538 domain-containing protein n=1 Tax=Methylobacterium marchantiae TaxID=600331 RepID=A0ABW3X2D0_9HYPH|nr:Tyrosine recombinase XerC [Methylobacterium marchantiae]
MARPWKHPKTGVYYLRRRVPQDLIELVGRTHEKKSLGTKDPAQARALQYAAASKLEERWANLRNGVQPLTAKQVSALAGDIYRAKVAEHSDEPGPAEHWRRLIGADRVLQELRDRFQPAPSTPHPTEAKTGQPDLRGRFEKKPSALRLAAGWTEADAVVDIRVGATVDEFLASKGFVVSEEDRRRIVLAAGEAARMAHETLLRNAQGDYTPDANALRFPASLSAVTPLKFEELWAKYVKETEASAATVKRWHPVLRRFIAFVGFDDLRRVTKEDVIRWRDKVSGEGSKLAPLTIRDVYLAAPKALLGFAVEQSMLGSNPAADITVRVKKKKTFREPDFKDEEAEMILSASLAPQNDLSSRELKDARRWVPWLCAYSGARVNEMTQLRRQDVKLRQGIWVVDITPEAGTTKNGNAREVPIHEHLIEQGFLDFVKKKPAGPLFYNLGRSRNGSPATPPSVRMGQKIAEWVRVLGVNDPNVQPNHGWRHRFKTVARISGVDSTKLDYIQGHAPSTEGKKYGHFPPRSLKPEIDKIPRYEVVASDTVDRRRSPRKLAGRRTVPPTAKVPGDGTL